MKIVCIICTELLTINSHMSVCNCGHLFHEECLFRWLRTGQQQTCPQCRAKVCDKAIIKRLFLTEMDLTASQANFSKCFETGQINAENYERLLSALDEFKSKEKENLEALSSKSKQLEQKEAKVKELETSNSNLKKSLSENQLLLDYLKKELENQSKIKEQYDAREKFIFELESKLREYKSIDYIYKEHESAFENEMRKYLSQTTNLSNCQSIIRQLVSTNVLLKEHSDKQMEEKRLIRKKLIQIENAKNEREKLISKQDLEIKDMQQVNEKLKEDLKQKETEIERLKEEKKRIHLRATSTPGLKKEIDNDHLIVNDTIEYEERNEQNHIDLNEKKNKSFIRNDDSDIQFLDQINHLENKIKTNLSKSQEENVECDKKNDTDSELNSFIRKEMALDDSDSDIPAFKRRLNPFLSAFDLNEQNDSIKPYQENAKNQIKKLKTKMTSFNELSLSQRFRESPTGIEIVKPIISNLKRPRLPDNLDETKEDYGKFKNEKRPASSSNLPSSSGFTYLYDGLGGRKKMFSSNDIKPLQMNGKKPSSFFTKSKVSK